MLEVLKILAVAFVEGQLLFLKVLGFVSSVWIMILATGHGTEVTQAINSLFTP